MELEENVIKKASHADYFEKIEFELYRKSS